jgi:RNA recognition motif-containing protein
MQLTEEVHNEMSFRNEQDGSHLSQCYISYSMKVKNTFIECYDRGDDALTMNVSRPRRFSAPALYPFSCNLPSEASAGEDSKDSFYCSSPDEQPRQLTQEEPDVEPESTSNGFGTSHSQSFQDTVSPRKELPQSTIDKYPFLRGASQKTWQPQRDLHLLVKKLKNWGDVTTIMMRNVPDCYTQKALLEKIQKDGFGKNSFDFFYLPMDKKTQRHRGYAFINFVDSAMALHFMLKYDGCFLDNIRLPTPINVSAAALQGFESNYAHYATCRINQGEEEFRPLFFRECDLQIDMTDMNSQIRGQSAIDLAFHQHLHRSQAARKVSKNKHSQLTPQHSFCGTQAHKRENQIGAEYMPIHQKSLYGFESVIPAHALHKEHHPIFCPACGIKAAKVDHFFCQSCGSTLRDGRPHPGKILTTCPPPQPQPAMMPQMTVPPIMHDVQLLFGPSPLTT